MHTNFFLPFFCIKKYFLQREITPRELTPSPYFLLCRYILSIPMCLQKLMNIHHCVFKILGNKSCRRTASSPAGYILYCNIFIIKPYNIGHTDLDVFVCKSFCHIDIIIQV